MLVVIKRLDLPSFFFVRDVSFRVQYTGGMLASAYTLIACLLPAALAFSPGFPYGAQKVRGVSLGGWLLIEVRIPSSFLFLSSSFCARYVFLTRLSSFRSLSAAVDYSQPIRRYGQQQYCR